MPEPPGSGVQIPPAGTVLASPTGMPPANVLYGSEKANVTAKETNVKSCLII
jgi:hypothetical protein